MRDRETREETTQETYTHMTVVKLTISSKDPSDSISRTDMMMLIMVVGKQMMSENVGKVIVLYHILLRTKR